MRLKSGRTTKKNRHSFSFLVRFFSVQDYEVGVENRSMLNYKSKTQFTSNTLCVEMKYIKIHIIYSEKYVFYDFLRYIKSWKLTSIPAVRNDLVDGPPNIKPSEQRTQRPFIALSTSHTRIRSLKWTGDKIMWNKHYLI